MGRWKQTFVRVCLWVLKKKRTFAPDFEKSYRRRLKVEYLSKKDANKTDLRTI